MRNRIKSLASDTMIYGTFTMLGRFLTFMLAPLYTNFLTKTEIGAFAYLFAIIPFLNIVYSLGMDASYFRFYDKSDVHKSKVAFTHSFITIALLSGTLTIIGILASDWLAPRLTSLPNGSELVKMVFLIPFLDILMVVPYALLRMTGKARRFAMIRFILVIIAVFFNLLFVVVLEWGIKGVFYAQLISSASGVVIFLPEILKQMVLKFNPSLFRQMLRFGMPTIPASFSAIALQVIDRAILKELTNEDTVGEYNIGYKLGIPMMMLVTMFEYAWKPFYLSRYKDSDAKKMFARVMTYFTLFASGIFLFFSLFTEYIVQLPFIGGRLINPDYWESLKIIPIIMGGYFFNGLFTNFTAGFYINKKTDYLPIAMGVAAIVNIAMNFLLIPEFGYMASAWATLAAYFVCAMILYIYSRKIYPLKYEWKRVLIIISATLAIFFVSREITQNMQDWLSILIRLAAVLTLLIILWISRFFTPAEIAGMKNLFKKNRNKAG